MKNKLVLNTLCMFLVIFSFCFIHTHFYANYVVLNKLNLNILLNYIDKNIEKHRETADWYRGLPEVEKNQIAKSIKTSALNQRAKDFNLKFAIYGNLSNQYYQYDFPSNFEGMDDVLVIQERMIFQYYTLCFLIGAMLLFLINFRFK